MQYSNTKILYSRFLIYSRRWLLRIPAWMSAPSEVAPVQTAECQPSVWIRWMVEVRYLHSLQSDWTSGLSLWSHFDLPPYNWRLCIGKNPLQAMYIRIIWPSSLLVLFNMIGRAELSQIRKGLHMWSCLYQKKAFDDFHSFRYDRSVWRP
jgi:hypothetical protein